jgi:HSP20 family protein
MPGRSARPIARIAPPLSWISATGPGDAEDSQVGRRFECSAPAAGDGLRRGHRCASTVHDEQERAMNELRTQDPFGLEPFDDAFRSMMRPWRFEAMERAPQIRVDVHEDESGYTIKADIPGVKKEDIDVRLDGNVVTVGAEVKREQQQKKEGRVLRSERYAGYASRSFSLGCDVDEGHADARYADGVLTLKLPKKAQSTAKRLSIA